MLQLKKIFLGNIFWNVFLTVLDNIICCNFKNVTTLKNFLRGIFWNVLFSVLDNIICDNVKSVTTFLKFF